MDPNQLNVPSLREQANGAMALNFQTAANNANFIAQAQQLDHLTAIRSTDVNRASAFRVMEESGSGQSRKLG